MCLYISHVRVCCRCRHEVTVLISESLCSAARRNGVFASCGTGPGSQRSPRRYHCWGCRENVAEDVEAELAAELAAKLATDMDGDMDTGSRPRSDGNAGSASSGSGRSTGSSSFSSAASSLSNSSSGTSYRWCRRGSMK